MVVISLNIESCDIHHILIDNRSSIDILYYNAFIKMNISSDRLGRVDSPLVSFIGDAIQVEGVVTLPVRMGQYPHLSIA